MLRTAINAARDLAAIPSRLASLESAVRTLTFTPDAIDALQLEPVRNRLGNLEARLAEFDGGRRGPGHPVDRLDDERRAEAAMLRHQARHHKGG